MATKEEVATMDNLELAIMGQAEFKMEAADPAMIAAEFVGKMNTAETEEDVFGENAPLGADDVLGVPLFIQTVRWAPSTKEGDGSKVFAIIDATRAEDGEHVLITCGGQKVLMRLLTAGKRGLLPTKTPKVFTSTATSRGNTVLDLVNA